MKLALLAAIVLVSGCSSGPEPAARPPSDVRIVIGSRYDKSFYQAGGKTVVSFRLAVSNRGNDRGRSADPECHTTVDDEWVELKIFENPELAPGDRGWFRTGGAVPRMSPREAENLEPYCDL